MESYMWLDVIIRANAVDLFSSGARKNQISRDLASIYVVFTCKKATKTGLIKFRRRKAQVGALAFKLAIEAEWR